MSENNLYYSKFDGLLNILCVFASIIFGLLPPLLAIDQKLYMSGLLLVSLIGIQDNIRLIKSHVTKSLESLLEYSILILALLLFYTLVQLFFSINVELARILNYISIAVYIVSQLGFRISELKKHFSSYEKDNHKEANAKEGEGIKI